MAAKSKAARKIRRADEFSTATLNQLIQARAQSTAAWSWSLEAIRGARDAQIAGNMRSAAKLAEAFRTDDALFAAWKNRLAPAGALPRVLKPAGDSARAVSIATEAEGLFGAKGIGVTAATVADLISDIANHGFAIGLNTPVPREDGSRVDFFHSYWPMREVSWNAHKRTLETAVDGAGGLVPITHGDGRWTVYSAFDSEPWTKDAAVIPGALLWAARAYANRAWSSGANSHGNTKTIGVLPDGVPLQNADGSLTDEARDFLALLMSMAGLDVPVGIKPYGSEIELLTDTSQAWQIYLELVKNKSSAANIIYLGQDIAKVSGSSQRLTLEQLFGIRNDVIETDLHVIERGLLTGVIEPWAAVNFGDSSLAPESLYLIPDADEDSRRSALAAMHDNFNRIVLAYKTSGMDVNQIYLDKLAASLGVEIPPLPASTSARPSIQLAPTDIAKVVRVNEARASAGLGPLTLADGMLDPDGLLTVEQFSAKSAATNGGVTPVPTDPSTPVSPLPA